MTFLESSGAAGPASEQAMGGVRLEDAAFGLLPRKPFAGSQGRVVRVVGLGLCPEGTGSLKNIHSFKDICQVCCGSESGPVSPGGPSGRRSLQGVASGRREGELWSFLRNSR